MKKRKSLLHSKHLSKKKRKSNTYKNILKRKSYKKRKSIRNNLHFTIYFKHGCSFCHNAFRLLKKNKIINITSIDSSIYNINTIHSSLIKKSNHLDLINGQYLYYPKIFITTNNKTFFLGGYNNLENYLKHI